MKSRNELAALLRECRERVGPTAVSEVRDLIARIDAALAPEAGGTVRDDGIPRCQLCGEPMPKGEEMFNYHGYSGPCPVPKTVEGEVAT